ncbi:MAG: flavin reductase family protein [Actinomycetota bacterium]|nr:flavin reductase family protein [Actinomycetota bacterium]
MPAGSVDPLEYRRVVARFATGITVVTTQHEGAHHAMTVNSFTSVSLVPLLVLISVEKIARFHPAVLAAGVWGVSVLAAGQEDVARWFATRGRPSTEDQFDGIRHRHGPETGTLLLDDALATLECRTVSVTDAGDHTVVLGEVLSVRRPATGEPLLYFDSRYHSFDPADRRD